MLRDAIERALMSADFADELATLLPRSKYRPNDSCARVAGDYLRGRADVSVAADTEAISDEDSLPDFPESAWRGAFADYREAMAGTTEASDVAHFGAC